MAKEALKQALAPLIAKVRKRVEGGEEIIQITKNGQEIKIPFSSSTRGADTIELQ